MKNLEESIENLKNSKISEIIHNRIKDFVEISHKGDNEIFKELCFCIMTANCGAEKCIEIHEKIGNDFIYLSNQQLVEKFKDYGYRFPNVRAKFILEARQQKKDILSKIKSDFNDFDLRNWFVKNIKGIGYKEASHFLRNIGFKNYAIIDFHIVDILVKNGLIEKPKTMTKKKYLEFESILKNLAKKLNLNLAELDLYLWFMETGKILK